MAFTLTRFGISARLQKPGSINRCLGPFAVCSARVVKGSGDRSDYTEAAGGEDSIDRVICCGVELLNAHHALSLEASKHSVLTAPNPNDTLL